MTFKVISVSGIPKLVTDKKTYIMFVDQYPVYKVTVDIETPVSYHYILDDSEESFDRVANDDTLIEFFNRENTVIKHPLLPLAYEESSITKKSKLYDGIFLKYIYIYV